MSTNLTLHSPSRIIGTPFATTSTRFEYPFPDCPAPDSSSPSSSPPINNSPTSSPGSCASTYSASSSASSLSSSHCSFGSVSLSFSLPRSLPPSAQFHRSITLVSSPCTTPTGIPGQHDHTHSPLTRHHTHHNHPKLRLQNPPPIPPTLIIKRNRWNLAYLGLKKDTVSPSIQDDPVLSIDASLPASE